MDNSSPSLPLAGSVRRFFSRLLANGENRFQLLVVEAQEERDRFLNMVFHALVAATLGLLCAIAWTAALVILLWPYNHALTLLILGAVYGTLAFVFWRRLMVLQNHQLPFAATLEQLRKDRSCLEKI